jgi:regulator of chromosome condensation
MGGDVYAWGSNEGCSLGFEECELLVPFNTGLNHIVRLYAGAYHNFAIDDNNNVWVFGLNNMGQCGLDESEDFIIPSREHPFFNKVEKKIDEIVAGQHHTLALMHDGQIYSFGRSDNGQLGLGNNVISNKRVVAPTVIPNLTSIKLIGAREDFSIAIDTAKNIYAWGFGETLILGDKELNETSPLQISGLNELEGKDIVRISCGSLHVLFLVAINDILEI